MRTKVAVGGVVVCGLLAVPLTAMRLCGVIDWAWWLILLPLWGPAILTSSILAILLIMLILDDPPTRTTPSKELERMNREKHQ